jgi:hypothetical protein
VLLSDGTGNSAAKLFKTNVWRIYDALDLRNPEEQVACYDDGVGTSTFRPLALLGGALGFGLKRNVLRLYRFLCEQYEPGDRIYAFGFSRGAYTIRVLAALVADQGIIRVRRDKFLDVAAPKQIRTTMTAGELTRLSARAYRHFRHHFDHTLPVVALGRWLREHWFDIVDRVLGRTVYQPSWNHHLGEGGITFLGLWDTVDAYGLPIDELTEGVDRWIWPLSLPELSLSDKVANACHALSLDDERHTFHPVLWDESGERPGKDRAERMLQVWFAGAHANVGGGYPNDALSAVSLHWIAREAETHQARFLTDRLQSWTDRRDPLGAAYDSRRGMAASYRYSPRRIEHLTNGQVHEQAFFGRRWPKPKPVVLIGRPKIHESVFQRIGAGSDFYAPIGLPGRYSVVKDDGSIVDGERSGFEDADQSAARCHAQEVVWNLVWYRRLAYFAGLGVAVLLFLRPLRDGAQAVAQITEDGGGLWLISAVGRFLPDAALGWVNYYAAAPWELGCGLGALLVVLVAGRLLRSGIHDRMHRIWRWTMAGGKQADLRLPQPRGLLYWLRCQPFYHGTFAVVRRIVIPNLFGPLVLLCVLAGLNRAVFETFNVLGASCGVPSAAAGSPLTFDTSSFCHGTGVRIERGARYELTARFTGAKDDTIDVAGAGGFGSGSPGLRWSQRAIFALFSPFKRVWSAGWFAVVARVGRTGVEEIPFDGDTVTFTARNDGELFLFVNDAILPVAWLREGGARFGWSALYANNRGSGQVTITRISK